MRPPIYLPKVIDLQGNVIASPLPAAGVRFIKKVALPTQQDLGSFTIDLKPARGSSFYFDETYRLLDYKQRVEIYEDRIEGEPMFTGRVDDLPSDLGRESIGGMEYLGRLGERHVHHFETVSGTIDDNIREMLKTWEPLFKDSFNRAAIGADWNIASGNWSIVSNQLNVNGLGEIRHTLPDLANRYRAQVDILTGPNDTDWKWQLVLYQGGVNRWLLSMERVVINNGEPVTRLTLEQPDAGLTLQRDASQWELPFSELANIDLMVKGE